MTQWEFTQNLIDSCSERTNALIDYQNFYNMIKALCNESNKNHMTDEYFIKSIKREVNKFINDGHEYEIKWEIKKIE